MKAKPNKICASKAGGKPEKCFIEDEVQKSYLDYAMSVIVSRALPDVRDGLKPVQRRILYGMWKMGLKSDSKNRKSAAIVGEIMGKYHPHGDQAIYDTLARMAQDFSLRYPLINGQGNWGSIDGDSPAAMRYTEARLFKISEEILYDLEKETVDLRVNYDGTLNEPVVLPAKLPNLLLNGSMGIAVAMATNIPPHNLKEVASALIYLLDHPKGQIDEIFKFIKGPDFPGGGLIFEPNKIKEAYLRGRGPIIIRAKTEIIKNQIIISEIPYLVNKASLVSKIVDLIKEKQLEEIRDLRDESTKAGIRIVIELKKGSWPEKVLHRLFKLTQLQTTYHFNFVALDKGLEPKLFSLKEILERYLSHRQIVIRKRTSYDLKKTEEKIHILKGFIVALKNIEKIIILIKKSKNKEEAAKLLQKKYILSEVQTEAILGMRLYQLSHLEQKKIDDELKEKIKLSEQLKKILAQDRLIKEIIKRELEELVNLFEDKRRTEIVDKEIKDFSQKDIIPNVLNIVVLTHEGYIKRLKPEIFHSQARGGKGVIGFAPKEGDLVQYSVSSMTHSNLLFFTNFGRAFLIKTYELPEALRTSRGQPIIKYLKLKSEEKIASLLTLSEKGNPAFLVMVTEKGQIKKIRLSEFKNIRSSGIKAIRLSLGDNLKAVKIAKEGDEIVLVTELGQAIRFNERNLRPMGRIAAGIRGIYLAKEDKVISLNAVKASSGKVLIVTENGFGKRSDLKKYRLQRRGGHGIKTAKLSEKTGKIVSATVIDEKEFPDYIQGDLLIISKIGQVIRLPLKSVPVLSRSTQGVRLMRPKEDQDRVASVTLV